MNEDKWNEYYARLGIKPPSPAAVIVRDDEVESAIPERANEKVLVPPEVAKAKVVEGPSDHKPTQGNSPKEKVTEIEVDEKSASALESKAADELEPERATLATATILPLCLLDTKEAWVWMVVLVCVAIAAYFYLRWYLGKGESTSLPKHGPQTVEEFLGNF